MNVVDKLLMLKFYFNRANSHLALFTGVVKTALLGAVFLKIFDIQNYLIVGVVGAVALIVFFIVGYLDVKFGIAERETEIYNDYNPTMRRLRNFREVKK